VLYKKAINNNTKGRKRYEQSAERKNKRSSKVVLSSLLFRRKLKERVSDISQQKQQLYEGKKREKSTLFFLNFFQSIKFFSFLQKNVRVLHYARDI